MTLVCHMDAQEDDVESLDPSYAPILGVICVRGKDCGAQDAWTVVVRELHSIDDFTSILLSDSDDQVILRTRHENPLRKVGSNEIFPHKMIGQRKFQRGPSCYFIWMPSIIEEDFVQQLRTSSHSFVQRRAQHSRTGTCITQPKRFSP